MTRSGYFDVIKATSATAIVAFGSWKVFRHCKELIEDVRKRNQEQEFRCQNYKKVLLKKIRSYSITIISQGKVGGIRKEIPEQ